MIDVIIALIAVGLLLYLLQLLPLDGTIKNIIHVFVIICVVIWLLRVFGLLGADIPVPHLH